MKNDIGLLTLLQNKHLRILFTYSELIAFTSANLLVGAILYYWGWEGSLNGFILVYVFGFVFAFIFVKTRHVLRVKENTNKSTGESETIRFDKLNVGFWNGLIIWLRLLFFNTLNELFIVLIFWIIYFIIILLILNLFGSSINTNIIAFTSIISTLGILSGFFQYYLKNYKENTFDKIINYLVEQVSKLKNEVTFGQFLKFIQDKDRNFYEEIISYLRINPLEPTFKVLRETRSGKDVLNLIFNVFNTDDRIYFTLIETSDRVDKEKLRRHYASFFEEKGEKIKRELDKLPFTEIRKTVFSDIVFFDEVFTEFIKSQYEVKRERKLNSYEDYLTETVRNIVFHLISRILGVNLYENAKQQV